MIRGLLLAAGLVLAGAAPMVAAAKAAPSPSKDERYIHCTFRPQAPSCQEVYRQALLDPDPDALSVRDAYEHYGRYVLSAHGGLTEADRQYLKKNRIALPAQMTQSDLAGLHAVINDPKLKDAATRRLDVNGYLDRAIEAELYCGFNACEDKVGIQSEAVRTS